MLRSRWGAALDHLPLWKGLPLGLGLGALAGVLLLLAPAAAGVPAFLLLCAAAAILAWRGEPVEALPAPSIRSEHERNLRDPDLMERPFIGMAALLLLGTAHVEAAGSTVRDRIVQTALRNVLEPIFERDFAALPHLTPRPP